MTATLYGTPVTDAPDDLLSVSDVADLLGLTIEQVRGALYSRRLPGLKDPGRTGQWWIRRSQAEAYRTRRPRQDLLTVSEAAEILGSSAKKVRELIYAHALPAARDEIDKNYRLRREDVEDYRDGRLQPQPSPMVAELSDYAARIAAAKKAWEDLAEERNRAAVRWVDQGASVTEVATLFPLSRDRASTLLQKTRSKIAEEAAKRGQS